jgi:hypothetical protein
MRPLYGEVRGASVPFRAKHGTAHAVKMLVIVAWGVESGRGHGWGVAGERFRAGRARCEAIDARAGR